MSDYVALHYIPLKKGLVTPGEIISDLPEDAIPRLLAKGAIQEIAPAAPAEGRAEEKPAKAAKAKPESVPEPVEPEITEETGEDAEVEIDALDGVVTAPKEEKPKTRKASSKAKGGKA